MYLLCAVVYQIVNYLSIYNKVNVQLRFLNLTQSTNQVFHISPAPQSLVHLRDLGCSLHQTEVPKPYLRVILADLPPKNWSNQTQNGPVSNRRTYIRFTSLFVTSFSLLRFYLRKRYAGKVIRIGGSVKPNIEG